MSPALIPARVLAFRFALSAFALAMLLSPGAAARGESPRGLKPPQVHGSQGYPETIPPFELKPAFPELRFRRPIFLAHAGDGSGRLFVVEQAGRIHVFPDRPDVKEAKLFLDLKDRVFSAFSGGHNEEGMLALAFHPNYRENGYCYVYYNLAKPRRSVISRFKVSADDPDRLDPASEKVILEVPQPFGNHKGCCLLFGPDGFLYISLGDGGAAYDPFYHGQRLDTLLGTVLRIDVDRESDGRAYAIPADNPLAGRDDAKPEIWAYGLRNVWRMSFDRQTGQLWGGDVGQDRLEEIVLIERGGNYGWNLREGTRAVDQKSIDRMRIMTRVDVPRPAVMDNPGPLIEPIVEYGREEGMSVTGGYVYRGERLPTLQGVYVYADYATGSIWGLKYADGRLLANNAICRQPKNISSFGEGPEGELYLLSDEGMRSNEGTIYVLIPKGG